MFCDDVPKRELCFLQTGQASQVKVGRRSRKEQMMGEWKKVLKVSSMLDEPRGWAVNWLQKPVHLAVHNGIKGDYTHATACWAHILPGWEKKSREVSRWSDDVGGESDAEVRAMLWCGQSHMDSPQYTPCKAPPSAPTNSCRSSYLRSNRGKNSDVYALSTSMRQKLGKTQKNEAPLGSKKKTLKMEKIKKKSPKFTILQLRQCDWVERQVA